MRVGIVRSDIGHIYLNDVENVSLRDASMQPPGQSRYFHKPTDAELTTLLNTYALVTVQGSNTAVNVDTTVANGTKLNIKSSASAAVFTQITVTSGATTTKTQIALDLNNGFKTNGLQLVARVAGNNQITIDTTNGGPNALISISSSSPSTAALQTVLGLAAASTSGISLATLKSSIYPTATTFNVATATLTGLGTFSLLSTTASANLVTAIGNAVAPQLVETGPVLLSYALGEISKMLSASFQPGGTRAGLSAGVAAYVTANDGTTVFSL